jgi:hypothetical protein
VSEKIRVATLGLLLIALTAGCGKDPHKSAASTHASGKSGATAALSDTTPADTTVSTPEPEPLYKTSYDPKAVYGAKDLPGRGSYLKVDWSGLSANQMNRVIHRLRTEFCTCGCKGDLIDQCLVNDPSCETAVTLAKQIIREEKMKS